MRYMLQSLLAERFNLKLHSEAKEMAIFALALDKSGVKFQSSTKPCGESGCIDVAPGEFIAKYATMDSDLRNSKQHGRSSSSGPNGPRRALRFPAEVRCKFAKAI